MTSTTGHDAMTHASTTLEVRTRAGISDDLIRPSVGLEEVQDLRGIWRRP